MTSLVDYIIIPKYSPPWRIIGVCSPSEVSLHDALWPIKFEHLKYATSCPWYVSVISLVPLLPDGL